MKVLIQWTGLPNHESTWNLEDKLRFVGRDIDTLQQVYFRKRGKKINVVGLTGEEELLEEEKESKASEEKRGFEEEEDKLSKA